MKFYNAYINQYLKLFNKACYSLKSPASPHFLDWSFPHLLAVMTNGAAA
ncbi:hypothetical protein [Symbiopectobacterium purcellii]